MIVVHRLYAEGSSGAACRTCSLGRPPGHHARVESKQPVDGENRHAKGHCFLNNAAAAVAWVRHRVGPIRVGVVDFDYHQGTGTREHFKADPATYYATINDGKSYDADEEPGVFDAAQSAYAHIKEVPGRSVCINFCGAIKSGTYTGYSCTPEEYHRLVESVVCVRLGTFSPQLILFLAGLDCLAEDRIHSSGPTRSLRQIMLPLVPTDVFTIMTTVMQAVPGARVSSLLEGGYTRDLNTEGIHAMLCALLGRDSVACNSSSKLKLNRSDSDPAALAARGAVPLAAATSVASGKGSASAADQGLELAHLHPAAALGDMGQNPAQQAVGPSASAATSSAAAPLCYTTACSCPAAEVGFRTKEDAEQHMQSAHQLSRDAARGRIGSRW